jgi:hypothetical protein
LMDNLFPISHTSLPHPPQKKQPWAFWVHEYIMFLKLFVTISGLAKLLEREVPSNIANIMMTSQTFPQQQPNFFYLGWRYESCNGCKGKWFENKWLDNL